MRCPRCSTDFIPAPGAPMRCPKCGYAGGPVTPMRPAATPSRIPSPNYGAPQSQAAWPQQGYGHAQPPGAWPQQGYGAPQGYGQPPAQGRKSGLAVAGMVLGIVSVVLCFLTWLDIIIGLVGAILSGVAMAKTGPGKLGGRAFAVVGLVTSLLGILLAIIIFVVALNYLTGAEYCSTHPTAPTCG